MEASCSSSASCCLNEEDEENAEVEDCDESNLKPVPLWLQASDLYKTMLRSGMELHADSFEPRFLRDNLEITSFRDFEEVVGCVDYWGVYDWPSSLHTFIENNVDFVLGWRSASGLGISGTLEFSDACLKILKGDKNTCCEKMAEVGSLMWLQYFHSQNYSWNEKTCTYAAYKGHLNCLQYAHEHGCPWNEDTCYYAASEGHLACLQYAHENGCPWNEGTCSCAAESGHLACLQYVHENGCPWDEEACSHAAWHGHLSCLQYAHENGCPWNQFTYKFASGGGHISCMEYCCSKGCPTL